MMTQSFRRRKFIFSPCAPLLLAVAAVFALCCGALSAADAGGFRAVLLTTDLGDPGNPGNVKIEVAHPAFASAASVRADDFRVYVYPAELSREDGVRDRYRAGGVYVWKNGGKAFLDVRSVPRQDNETDATVRVVYAPEGRDASETVADGRARYANDHVDVVLAVDVSLSMNRYDPKKLRVAAARTFIEMARKSGGVGRVSLVTFNHAAKTNIPLIPLERGEELLAALDRVGAAGMTNLDEPLKHGMRQLEGSRKPVVILLTDGRNEGHEYENTHLEAARDGVRIFSVGLSEKADHELLRTMAKVTGGIYFRAVKDSDLPEIYARLAAELGKRRLLHSETLRAPSGEITLPIDTSVRRLVVMTDGGGRVGMDGPGHGRMSGEDMTSVHMGSPDAGDWLFTWNGAAAEKSALSLFGDTRLFLDAFPPQIRHEHLALAATLARDGKPLTGARVWVEPVPGLVEKRLRLHDDGLHGDGGADDGVYGVTVELPVSPRRVELTFRAAGEAWDGDRIVRQASESGIQSGREPPARARLDGEVDFGVLFPGETGSGTADIDLEAKSPRHLSMDLNWGDGSDWPDLRSEVTVRPGRRSFELEMTVPAHSAPGEYIGTFTVSGDEGLTDSSTARVRVGDIRFAPAGAVDLGVVPPGTFVSREVRVGYDADKGAPLSVAVVSGEDVSLNAPPDSVEAGRGDIVLEVVVSAPMGQPEGEYTGELSLRAGPGATRIPLRWQVRPYAVKTVDMTPVSGLPKPPELPAELAPLTRDDSVGRDPWLPESPAPERADETVESPWERSERAFRESHRPSDTTAASPSFTFPAPAAPAKGGSGFWSAWWVYVLAALLLLLLLLLLLAYILYRLGKSALARLLVVSALANIILLAIFVLLLSAASSVAAQSQPTVIVNLVEDAPSPMAELTETERDMLGASGSSPAGAGGESVAVGELSFADAAASTAGGGELVREKATGAPALEETTDLADSGQPSAMPLENREQEPLRRRDVRRQREDRAENQPAAAIELPEMAEPAAEGGRPAERREEVGEAKLDLDMPDDQDSPVWSDGDRIVQPLGGEQDILLADASGMEKVSHDVTARRMDPRGHRVARRDSPAAYPEPRVEVDDPVRDVLEIAAAETRETLREDPGVEELRAEERVVGIEPSGRRAGALVPPGAARLADMNPRPMPLSESGDDTRERAAPRGGRRNSRGAAGVDGSPLTARDDGLPGGMSDSDGGASSGAVAAKSAATGVSSGANSTATGERRFDGAPSSSGNGDGLLPSGDGRATTGSASGQVDSPSPIGGGSRAGDGRTAFSEGPGGGGDAADNRRGGQRRGDRGGEMPGGVGGIPGSGGGETGDGGPAGPGGSGPGGDGVPGGSGGRGRGRGGDGGEGRFDDMDGPGDGGGRRFGSGSDLPGVGRSAIGDGRGGGLSGVLPFSGDEYEWTRNAPRGGRRAVNMAASSVDMDSLLLVVGEFSRNPDPAAAHLFDELKLRVGEGLTVEERLLAPADVNLSDCLLAILSPDEANRWSDAAVARVAGYLERGGHIWIDSKRPADIKPFMERLAGAAGGTFGPLPEAHQLAEDEIVDSIGIGDKLAVVATYQDWRSNWRHASADGRAMRFFVRSLNYFLSGNAETGVSLEPGVLRGGVRVEAYDEHIPDNLAGDPANRGRLWDEFGPATAAAWRMPSWSDKGRIAAVSDGEGGRALRMDMLDAAKGRSAVYRTLTPPQDFTPVNHVTLEAYYDGEGEAQLSFILTVEEAGGWRDYESGSLPLMRGWNSLRFNLRGGGFHPLSGDGADGLPSSRRAGRAGLFLYREASSPGVILFRDIRLHE